MSKTQKIEQVNLAAEGVVVAGVDEECKFDDIKFGNFFTLFGIVYFKRNNGEALRMDNLFLEMFEPDETINQCQVSQITINVMSW